MYLRTKIHKDNIGAHIIVVSKKYIKYLVSKANSKVLN